MAGFLIPPAYRALPYTRTVTTQYGPHVKNASSFRASLRVRQLLKFILPHPLIMAGLVLRGARQAQRMYPLLAGAGMKPHGSVSNASATLRLFAAEAGSAPPAASGSSVCLIICCVW